MLAKDINKHNLYWRREVNCPVTNQNVIIFPFNFKVLEFISNFYNPEMTDNRLQSAQIDTYLEEIQGTCEYFTLLRTWDSFFFKCFYYSVTIALIFVFTFEKSFPRLAIFFFIIFMSIGVLGIVYNIVRVPWIFSTYRKKILGIIKYSNDTYFKAMGMKLALSPKNFDWIELWLEYRYKNEPNRAIFNDYGEGNKKFHGGNSQYSYPYLPGLTTKQALPPSTPNSVVFPFDYKKFEFYFHFYTIDMSDNVVRYQDVQEFFQGLQQETNDFKILSSRVKWEVCTLIVQWILVGLAIISGIYIPADFLDGHKILMMLGCFFAPYLIQMFRTESRDDAFNRTRDIIERYLLTVNYEYKKDRVKWVLSKSQIDYIELWNYGNLSNVGSPEKLDMSFNAKTEEDEANDNDTLLHK